MDNESFERALEPQPTKRKRSSILKPAEKRVSRDLRTVSFNERCIYKELHQDGTCDITNLFLREDMDLTMMDIVEPINDYHNQTINSSMDMSMEQASLMNSITTSTNNNNNNNHRNNGTMQVHGDDDNDCISQEEVPEEDEEEQEDEEQEEEEEEDSDNNNCTLTDDKMIEEELEQKPGQISTQQSQRQSVGYQPEQEPEHQPEQEQLSVNMSIVGGDDHHRQMHLRVQLSDTHNNSSLMDLTLISQFINTMPKANNIDLPSINYDASTIYDKKMDVSGISSLNSTLVNNITLRSNGSRNSGNTSSSSSRSSIKSSNTNTSSHVETEQADESSYIDTTLVLPRETTMNNTMMMANRISEISSLNNTLSDTLANQSANETCYGAFHDSNDISIQSRTSGIDTMVHHIEALSDCIEKVDQETNESRQRLDNEIANLFKFYRHIVNKDNKYEFAIKIFGLRYGLWLIIKLNPDNYPNEKLSLKFAVNKRDRHLYPFPEYAEAVRRCTKEGKYGYLTKFVINAQKFRRFLRATGYRKKTETNRSNCGDQIKYDT